MTAFTRFLIGTLLMASPVAAQDFALVDGKLPSGPNQGDVVTILVSNGQIEAIGSDLAIPSSHKRITAEGNYITAPLFAAATQIGLIANGAAASEDDSTDSGSLLGASFDPSWAFDPAAETVLLAKMDGVGGAMIYPGTADSVFAGTGFIADLSAEPPKVATAQAALFALAGNELSPVGGSRASSWSLLYKQLNTSEDDLMVAVRAGQIPLVLQIDAASDIRNAIGLSERTSIRVVIFGGAEAWIFAQELAEAKIPVIIDPLDDLPFYHVERGARRDNAAILAAAGVKLAFSVSAQGIYRSWNVAAASRLGAGVAVANGLPYMTALDAITSAPRQIWSGESGPSLAVGQDADLVIWSGDPLEPSSFPRTIYRRGEALDVKTRQSLLTDRYREMHERTR